MELTAAENAASGLAVDRLIAPPATEAWSPARAAADSAAADSTAADTAAADSAIPEPVSAETGVTKI